MIGHFWIRLHGNSSRGGVWVVRPEQVLIRPTDSMPTGQLRMRPRLIRRILSRIRRYHVAMIKRHLASLRAARYVA